jgi:hypothetical protein
LGYSPPGSGRFAPSLLAAGLAVGIGVVIGFTQNWWWLLVGVVPAGIAFYVAHQRCQAGVADVDR